MSSVRFFFSFSFSFSFSRAVSNIVVFICPLCDADYIYVLFAKVGLLLRAPQLRAWTSNLGLLKITSSTRWRTNRFVISLIYIIKFRLNKNFIKYSLRNKLVSSSHRGMSWSVTYWCDYKPFLKSRLLGLSGGEWLAGGEDLNPDHHMAMALTVPYALLGPSHITSLYPEGASG